MVLSWQPRVQVFNPIRGDHDQVDVALRYRTRFLQFFGRCSIYSGPAFVRPFAGPRIGAKCMETPVKLPRVTTVITDPVL